MYFIAGVGVASLFEGDRLVATANTLIDSGITIGTTIEDIRGGQGNKLLGRYGHDSQFSLKLTDAIFDLGYLAMNTGSDVELGGDCIKNESLTAKSEIVEGATKYFITLSHPARPFFNQSRTLVYIKPSKSSLNYKTVEYTAQKIEVEGSGDYCVRYMYNDEYATKIVINSDFIPKTLSLILEANLYSGGSCDDTGNATVAGKIVIKVPRFMLNGSQEIAMTATRAAQTSLEGMALTSGCNSCDGAGEYAEIVQVLANSSVDMFDSIVIEDANRTVKKGASTPLVVYACPKEGTPVKLNPSQYTVPEGAANTYSYANGLITISETASSPISVVVSAFGEKFRDELTITVVR